MSSFLDSGTFLPPRLFVTEGILLDILNALHAMRKTTTRSL
jgi:hypothetical protein